MSLTEQRAGQDSPRSRPGHTRTKSDVTRNPDKGGSYAVEGPSRGLLPDCENRWIVCSSIKFYNMLCLGGAGSRSKSQRHRVRRQSPVEERLSVHESDSMSDAFDDEGLFQIDENFAKFLDDKTSCQK